MVDVVERLGEVDEDRLHGLAVVNDGVPVMQHVDQGMRRGTLSESTVLPVVKAASDMLQYPRPDE